MGMNSYARRAARQAGSAAVEYLLVTILAVTTLVVASDGSTTIANLATAVIGFYADFSFAISLPTP